MKISVCKAEPITKNKPIDDAEIHIKDPLPEFSPVEKTDKCYISDAHNIFDILRKHLPGGTQHQLLILMSQGSPNLYRGI